MAAFLWGIRMLLVLVLLVLVLPPHSLPAPGAASNGSRNPGQDLVSSLQPPAGQRLRGAGPPSPGAGPGGPVDTDVDTSPLLWRLLLGLESLGVLPAPRAPQAQAPRGGRGQSRLSAFLHNVSASLQSEAPRPEPWGSLLQHLLPPPAPALRLPDFLLSLRGSRHWDPLLGLLHGLLGLAGPGAPDPPGPELLRHLVEALAQAVLPGALGQGPLGVSCAPMGHRRCSPGSDWLMQLLQVLEGAGWKPAVHVQPAGPVLAPGRWKPFSLPPAAAREQPPDASSPGPAELPSHAGQTEAGRRALGVRPGAALWGALEELKRGLLRRVGRSLSSSVRRKVVRVTGSLVQEVSVALGLPRPGPDGRCSAGTLQQLLLWGIHHNISWDAEALGFATGPLPSPPPLLHCMHPAAEPRRPRPMAKRALPEPWGEARILADLESVCNSSAPGLPGISNFTLYLYCNHVDGSGASSPTASDLGATCSDTAWYLLVHAAEWGSVWARACWEHFPAQFNATVCSNATLRDLPSRHQPRLQELCANLSHQATETAAPEHSGCLEALRGAPLSPEGFWSCFLENQTLWVRWLCNNASLQGLPTETSTGISQLCHSHRLQAKVLSTTPPPRADPCAAVVAGGSPPALWSASLLEQCRTASPARFRQLVCEHRSVLETLAPAQPWVLRQCLGAGSPPRRQCLLQQLLGALPLSPQVEAARLCEDPVSYLLELVSRLAWCEEDTARWLLNVNYLLRLLRFVLALPELGAGARAAQGPLGEAILLSSLLDNGSFWASLRANASLSILQALGRYLEQEQDPATKKELLSCFGPVLWDLIQREEGAPAMELLVQEYLQMPPESLHGLLLSVEGQAARQFLSLMHRTWHRLQVPAADEGALQSLTALLLRRFPPLTPVDLSQFIPFLSASDISSFPPALLANESVLAALQSHSARMTRAQKSALAQRLLQAPALGDIPAWPPELLRALQPLLPHLPLRRFLQLTPQQVQGLADSWQDVRLGLAQGRHVARSLINRSHGAGEEQVRSIGTLACFLSPEELQALAPLRDPRGPVEQSLLACAADGTLPPHGQVTYALADLLRSAGLEAMDPQELQAWRGVVPELGTGFLQRLSPAQVSALLPELQAMPLTPAQASLLLAQAVRSENVTGDAQGRLCALLPGLSPKSLPGALAPVLAGACECLAPVLPRLSAAQTAALLRAMQGLRRDPPPRSAWPDCLLPLVPLALLQPHVPALLGNDSRRYRHLPWAPQQAQLLWRMVGAGANMTQDSVWALGTLAAGMDCATLHRCSRRPDFLGILGTLYAQPGRLPASLRRCIGEEIRWRPGPTAEELVQLGPAFLVDLPMKLVERLPNDSLWLVLDHVSSHPQSLLALPSHRRTALARRALQLLRSPLEPEIPGEVLDLLGPLLGFLDRDSAARIRPESLLLRLETLQGACLSDEFAAMLGQLLLSRRALGPPQDWSPPDLAQLGRLVFLLPEESVRHIPRALLSRDALEQLLQSQRAWERSELGRLCPLPGARPEGRSSRDALVSWLVRSRVPGGRDPIPSCADMRATFPAAWSATQIAAMAPAHFEGCLELISQDPALSPSQRRAALLKAKQLFGNPRVLRPMQTLQLGLLATQLSERELQDMELADWGALSILGALQGWTARQMRAAVSSFLRQRGGGAQGLGLPELAALGHLLCGLREDEIQMLDSWELSQAAPFLGSLKHSCSEGQMEALAARLTSSSAFGPANSWGPEIFTEIGTLAAGLQDIELSSLVPEQIRALTPLAIAGIPAPKFSVVFRAAQLLALTSAQAAAVTPEQYELLSAEQRQGVASAQYEGELVPDARGRNVAWPLSDPALLLVLGLLSHLL